MQAADVQNKDTKNKEKETLNVGGRDIYIIPVVYSQTNANPGIQFRFKHC